MPPEQSPQNLGLALAQMGQGQGGQDQMGQGMPPFGQQQLNQQQLRGMQPPAPSSYAYQPQQSQMSMMQLSPTSQAQFMPMQQQANPWGPAMNSVAQSLGKFNQQNQSQAPYGQYDQQYNGNMTGDYGPGMFGY